MGYLDSYCAAKAYEIIPTETYKILHNCAGCGSKNVYQNTHKIRVNANGKKLDVCLIYQCSKCKHTYNLPIYSRVSRSDLDKAEYEALLRNDPKLVHRYGLNRTIFHRNGVKILEEPPFVLTDLGECPAENSITVLNPYHIRIRYDKLIASFLKISRTEAKKALEKGLLSVKQISDHEVRFDYMLN